MVGKQPGCMSYSVFGTADFLRTFRYLGKFDSERSPHLRSGNDAMVAEPVNYQLCVLAVLSSEKKATTTPPFHLKCGLRVKVTGTSDV